MRRDHVFHKRDDVLTAEGAEIAEMTGGFSKIEFAGS